MTDLLLGGLVDAVNALIAALGAVLAAAMSLLPGLPPVPQLGTVAWLGWLNWFFPVTTLLAGLAAFVLIWVTFLLVRIALKWARAL
jgi:hypothetical protein